MTELKVGQSQNCVGFAKWEEGESGPMFCPGCVARDMCLKIEITDPTEAVENVLQAQMDEYQISRLSCGSTSGQQGHR